MTTARFEFPFELDSGEEVDFFVVLCEPDRDVGLLDWWGDEMGVVGRDDYEPTQFERERAEAHAIKMWYSRAKWGE